MKFFLMSTAAAGITLSLIGAPLAIAESTQNGQNMQHEQHSQHNPPPHVPQHVVVNNAPQHVVVNKTTVQHTTVVHNTTNYNVVQHQYVQHQYVSTGGHQWHHGDYYNGDRHYVGNWQSYHLYQPPQGYQWVQDGSQFVLIAVASGIITDVILNAAYQ